MPTAHSHYVLEREWQELMTRYAIMAGMRTPALSEAVSHIFYRLDGSNVDIEFERGEELSFVFAPRWRSRIYPSA